MVNITLNCLIIPTSGFTGIPLNNVQPVITISVGNSVRNLHVQIQQQLPHQFRNVPFFLHAYHPGPVKYVAMQEEGSISDYFDENITIDVHHVLVEEDVYGYYNYAMSTITLSCLVAGENPYENAFNVKVNKIEVKVDIFLEKENKKLELVNTKINVNIKEELGGEELLPLSKISKHFTSQPADEHIHIIVQHPVETKEVHCTATYGRKSANFQWTVTRETVTLEGFKKKLCEYLTFLDGTENKHIIISRVIGGAGLKRKILTGKMCKKSDSSSQSATVESDTVEIVTECKVIQFSTDENLMSIIWTTNPKVDLKIVVDTYELLRLHKTSQHIISANEATRCEFISRIIYGVASIFDVTEMKKEDINQGIAQNAVQLQTSIQHNPKKHSYDTAGLHEDIMYGIVSTAVDWVIIKLVLSSSENNSEGKVEVLLSSLSPSPLTINNSVLTCEDLAKPVKNLFGQIKWVFDSQIESQGLLKRVKTE
ncbi:hypothetical protein C1645_821406 [Glomus cerebriforme]|uniref:Crinkler effector protein N-terminal domain-containing protein n=1 Tax=Glomus cerebriforme TaxID=658196 RepID=A0A397T9X5_9GLOM|nr:hypothetical protein C1645_821406 [Glomus cerebriforme]